MDFAGALTGLALLSPLLLALAIWVAADSRGGIFYRQQRIGKGGKPFWLYKFRTMRPLSDKGSLLTVGARDNRITRAGYWLRRYKLDELPQLWNVVLGDMSLVGPRPEVEKYVALYDQRQCRVLEVRPGLTDYASLAYFDENALLEKSADPEQTYIREIMPAKLELNLRYIGEMSVWTDLKLLIGTLRRIIK